jgi:hypothetical protein|tara:strand:- start:33 stop:965 length:933 start_codon:yes stop_codon:yes gene_type:complete
VIKYKDSAVDGIDLLIYQTEQKEEITFEGFSPDDATQKVSCTLEYNDREVDIQSIASFQMQDNLYLANVVIKNCKDILFNGRLDFAFSKHWFRHNILEGANLDDGYVHWDQMSFTDEEVFCVGDSFTLGEGVARDETWPSLLNLNAFNFGSRGLSHDCCVKNVKHILQNSKHVKQIICLLPSATRKLFNFEFLGSYGSIPISYTSEYTLPEEFTTEIYDIKELIFKGSIDDHWITACTDMIDLCNKHKVECWLSTWDHDMYMHIPTEYRLPIFPHLTTFTERASDKAHPHKKHYELFVKNIKPYVDKRQS